MESSRLCIAKILSRSEINSLHTFLATVSAMTILMFRHVGLWLGPVHPLLAIASKPAPGKSRPPATGYSPVFFGVLGSSLWCSSILRQSFAGIALVFDGTGV